jgi:hypothetical protein
MERDLDAAKTYAEIKKIEATPVIVLRSHRIGEEIKALPVTKEPTCSAPVATKGATRCYALFHA